MGATEVDAGLICTILTLWRTLNAIKYEIHTQEYLCVDAFSELIRVIRSKVLIYHNAMVCGNWQIHEKDLGITCFHMVTVGACRLTVPGYTETNLSAGDLVIFPKEIAHTMVPLNEVIGPQKHLPYTVHGRYRHALWWGTLPASCQ